VERDGYIPFIIAAGGGGRAYSSQSESQLEQMDYDPSQPGRNGKSHAAGTLRTALMPVCYCLSWEKRGTEGNGQLNEDELRVHTPNTLKV